MKRLIAAAVCLILAACGQPQTVSKAGQVHIRFATDWRAQAEHGGFYQALATGEYARRGLDVEIIQGGPSVNVPQLLAAGAVEMGMGSNSFIALNLARENAPVKAVAATMQKDPQVLIAHPDQGIGSIADMKGRPIMLSDASVTGFWLWLKSKYGFVDSQVRTNPSPAVFIQDKKAIMQGYVTSEPFIIQQKAGYEPKVFLLADEGYPGYAGMILSSDKLIKDHPEAVKAFVAATAAGWRSYLNGDPAPGDALIRKDNPEKTPAELDEARKRMKSYGIVESGDTQALGVGAMSDARWEAFFKMASAAGVYPATLDYHKAYTLEFLGRKVMGPAAPMIAGLDDVTVDYRGRRALGPVTLQLAAGEIIALVGPSGCGKSTALRLLAGLEAPTAGAVKRSLGPGETAVVFQAPTLMPWASATGNVALPLELAGVTRAEARKRAEEALARVKLPAAGPLKPAQLSGGMAMRAALARALVSDPKLLLLDEPFAALDEITRRALAGDIQALWAASRPTIVFVTHNVEEAVYMAGRVLVLSAAPGRLAGEVSVDGALPRPAAFRTSEDFRQSVESVSRLLDANLGNAA